VNETERWEYVKEKEESSMRQVLKGDVEGVVSQYPVFNSVIQSANLSICK
jgi:hypothetical protein